MCQSTLVETQITMDTFEDAMASARAFAKEDLQKCDDVDDGLASCLVEDLERKDAKTEEQEAPTVCF